MFYLEMQNLSFWILKIVYFKFYQIFSFVIYMVSFPRSYA